MYSVTGQWTIHIEYWLGYEVIYPRFGAVYHSQGLRTGRLTIGRTGAKKDFGQSEFLYIFELSKSFF